MTLADKPMNSKQRYDQRKREQYQAKLLELSLLGRKCGNCKHFGPSGIPGVKDMICNFHSDFLGYVTATENGLCVDHAEAKS